MLRNAIVKIFKILENKDALVLGLRLLTHYGSRLPSRVTNTENIISFVGDDVALSQAN